jgi:hypothetical protein
MILLKYIIILFNIFWFYINILLLYSDQSKYRPAKEGGERSRTWQGPIHGQALDRACYRQGQAGLLVNGNVNEIIKILIKC